MTSPVLQFKRGAFSNLPGLRAGEPGFTTDKYDFYVGLTSSTDTNKFFGSARYWKREDATNAAQLKLVDKDGSNFIAIAASDTLVGIATYRFPNTNDGTSGDFLKLKNASGGYYDLEWSAVPSGSFTITGDSGTDVFTTGETLTFAGTVNEIETAISNNQVQIGLPNNVIVGGALTVTTGAVIDGVQIGINGTNVIDTVSGDLTINSASGQTIIDDRVTIKNDLLVNGNVSIGGTTITLLGQDVYIENKDIVLGFTTSITPNDSTANHAGVAIASTEGTPLVNFEVSGINTLPSTYKQMMWFKSGTLGFSTDAFAFNYGVAIGTTIMANGVRLAVGSAVTVSDTSVSATTFYGSLVGNVSSADQVKTVTATDNNANYYVTFVDANNGSATNETVYTDDGIYYNPGTNKLTTQHAEFTGNVLVSGIATVGTGVGITQFSSTVGSGTSTSSVPTSSAVINYVGTQIAAIDLTTSIAGDTGTGTVSTSQTLTINGTANEVETSVSGQTVTVGLPDAVVVGTSLSAPTLRTGTIQSSNTGAAAITIAANDVTIADDLTVQGNLYVNGSTTQVNTASLTVEDRTIQLGIVDGSTPSSATTWDLGVLFNYYTDSAKQSAVVWEHGDGRFKFGSAISDGGGTGVNNPQITVSTFAPIEIGSLWVTDCAGTSQVISCTGSTRNLENITIDAGVF